MTAPFRSPLRLLLITLLWSLTACNAIGAKEEGDGVGLTGVDHLADHLSVSNFWVDGYSGFQAGSGGSLVCCVAVPKKWKPGLKAHVTWVVTNWKDRVDQQYEADVVIDRYEEVGRMFVHFLEDGRVRITLANESPGSPTYPGTHAPVPHKQPWSTFPRPRKLQSNNPFRDPDEQQQ